MGRQSYSDLLVLMSVAKARSFTKAAKELGISQSMLSYRMQRLEERLGVRLLTRTTRSVSLTEPGERLLQLVSPELDSLVSSLRALNNGPSKHFRFSIGGSTLAIRHHVLPFVSEVEARLPGIRLELRTNFRESIDDECGLDVWLDRGPARDGSLWSARLTDDVPLMIIASPSYLSAAPPIKAVEDLSRHSCICLKQGAQVASWSIGEAGLRMPLQIEASILLDDPALILEATLSGYGIAQLPEEAVSSYVKEGDLVGCLPSVWSTLEGYHVLCKAGRETEPAHSAVISMLMDRGP